MFYDPMDGHGLGNVGQLLKDSLLLPEPLEVSKGPSGDKDPSRNITNKEHITREIYIIYICAEERLEENMCLWTRWGFCLVRCSF